MSKKFCISTKGLSKEQRKDFATDLAKFVQEKKEQFQDEKELEDES